MCDLEVSNHFNYIVCDLQRSLPRSRWLLTIPPSWRERRLSSSALQKEPLTPPSTGSKVCIENPRHSVTFFLEMYWNEMYWNIIQDYSRGAVVAEWIRPQTSIPEVRGSNPSTVVVLLDKALYPHCLVPWKGLKAVGSPGCFLSGQVM